MKKTLASILALLTLSATLLTACGGGDTKAPASDTTAAADTTSAEVTEAVTTSEYADPGVDYNGAEFVMAAYDSDNYFWQAASYCDVYAESETGEPINDSLYQRNRAVEEQLNVKIKPYSVDVSTRIIDTEVKRLILAGEDLIDAAFVVGSGIPTMVGSGDMVYDLSTIDTLDLSYSWWDQKSVEYMSILGSIYAVTGNISLYANFAPIVYFVNKQLVSDFSLDNPYDTVRDGKWTLDKAIEMATAVAHDVNGDSKMDINDCYGMCGELSGINNMLLAAGLRFTEHNEEGIPELVYNNEKTISFFEKVIPFLNNKSVVTTSGQYSGYGNVFVEVFVPMFADNRVLFYNNQLLVAMNLRDMEADFGILPSPKFDENQEEYIGGTNNSWISFIVVPVTNGALDMTGIVLDAMGYYSQQYVTPAYIETTVLDKALRDEDSAEMLEIILASRTYDLAYYYNWGSISSVGSGLASSGSTDFASRYATSENAIKNALADTILKIESK